MAMKDSEAIYRMSHIRKLLTNVSDTFVTKLDSKGLVACQKQVGPIRTVIRYTACQICHLAVLRELSTFGVLNFYKDVLYVSGAGTIALDEPEKVVEYYRDHGPNIKIVIMAGEVPIRDEKRDSRMRRTKTKFAMLFVSDYEGYLATRAIANSYQDKNEVRVFSHLAIDFNLIARHVYEGLNISHMLTNF